MALRETALDAVDKAKAVFKNMSGRKKKNKIEATPTATAPADASSATTKPTETATAPEPAPAAPATAPETTQSVPAGDNPASPVPAPAAGDNKAAEQAALTEVKKATQSRSSLSFFYGQECDSGSRRRHKVGIDSTHTIL